MDIHRDRVTGALFLSQERYINKVLDRFGLLNSKPILTSLGARFKLFDEMYLR